MDIHTALMYLFLYDVSAQPRSPRSITHNDIPKSVGLLWLSDQLVAETSTSQHTTLTTENSYAPSGFEPIISAGERPQTHALDRATTGTGSVCVCVCVFVFVFALLLLLLLLLLYYFGG